MKLSNVLDQIRDENRLKNNTALANFLDIDFRRIPEYYEGREPMDDDYPKIALASGYRVDELQAIVKLSSTKVKNREIWEKYYKSIGGIATPALLMLAIGVTLLLTPCPANATQTLDGTPYGFVLC
jgi:hypothetical protein